MSRPKRKYRSEIAAAVHEGIRGMYSLGLVDKQIMRECDIDCLTLVEPITPEEIVALRERERALNVTTNYVSQIERGAKRPRGATLKLLSLVRSKGLDAIL